MNRPHTSRDALVSQLFEDFEGLGQQTADLQAKSLAIEARLQSTVASLDDATLRFEQAVKGFVEQAKADLNLHVEQTVRLRTEMASLEYRPAMEKSARDAFSVEALRAAEDMRDRLAAVTHHFQSDRWQRLKEYALVAASTALITVALGKGFSAF